MKVLLLGGTAEARQLASLLAGSEHQVTTSLAGATTQRLLPVGDVRVGGFGGAAGLSTYLRAHSIDAVIDATHPFAAQMTANAAQACASVGVPLLRLSRPSWASRPDASGWHWVDSLDAARRAAERMGERAFLATGRQSASTFASWTDRYTLLRVVDPPERVPDTWEVLATRGPFTLADEVDLLVDRRIDVLITKDSGGSTDAKLDAAAQLGIPVVMVARPPVPPDVLVVDSAPDAAAWLAHQEEGPDA